MEKDITRIYMMQVNNKDGGGSGVGNAPEIKKRADGEWGTLPAGGNSVSRNDLSPMPASSGQY